MDPAPRTPDDILDRSELCCLVGPTASGKSELALAVAERAGAEIVSLDSMLVYRGMDIGTAKPDAAMRARVPHHMLDRVEPEEPYDLQRYLTDVRVVLEELERRDVRALFVGGTALYLKALVYGLFPGPPADRELRARVEEEVREEGPAAAHRRLAAIDPPAAERIHANDTRRVVRALEVHAQTGRPLSQWQREWGWGAAGGAEGRARRLVGVRLGGAELEARVERRTEAMLDAGWAAEAAAVRTAGGFGPSAVAALGYAEVLELHDGTLAREECVARIVLRTRQFARRQRTWYRKFPEIRWVGAAAADEALEVFGWAKGG
ncbi:MAG: tRNA (adenosine(37)-N6)-dimethylallyltransferase MiaA [Planctomycetes bacterium]|jgi:tRNA dimethylallyltransferase|nr:tRNA (adenosine(37)-N6)-dimethylallyltransferase MiaA [Planctomycetota bacterium]MDP6409492.1 tRNA (adenosine(37)-N6)-dimethylallyltransferase MiaA [Planctomycetota bacterium]